MTLFSARSDRKNRIVVCLVPVCTLRSVKNRSSPPLFGVPSTLKSRRGSDNRLIGSCSHLAYGRLMKFSVAPESSRANASALLDFEYTKNRIVIYFRIDIYTWESVLRLISADLIRQWENPWDPVPGLIVLVLHLSWPPVQPFFLPRTSVSSVR